MSGSVTAISPFHHKRVTLSLSKHSISIFGQETRNRHIVRSLGSSDGEGRAPISGPVLPVRVWLGPSSDCERPIRLQLRAPLRPATNRPIRNYFRLHASTHSSPVCRCISAPRCAPFSRPARHRRHIRRVVRIARVGTGASSALRLRSGTSRDASTTS